MNRLETGAVKRAGLEVVWWGSTATAIIGGIIGVGRAFNDIQATGHISSDLLAPAIVTLAGAVISNRAEDTGARLVQEQSRG